MKAFHHTSVEEEDVPAPAEGVKIRWLITEETGAPNFSMRQFTVEAGGSTPRHTHPWEHEAYILEGSGAVQGGEDMEDFQGGDVIFVPSGELHQFRNTGGGELKFLCLIPHQNG
jgi:quercetin dioxygenase-like cupin family protein